MKNLFLKFMLYILVFCFAMAVTVQAAQRMSARAVQTPKTAQYIPVKPEFKNLTLKPMTVDSVVDELAGIVVLCSTATPNTARSLPQSSQKMLSAVIQLLHAGKEKEAKQVWQRLIKGLKSTTAPVNVNDLIYWVGHEAYLENASDLSYYAGKVKYYNALKTLIRNTLASNDKLQKSCRSSKRCSSTTLADLQKEIKRLERDLQQVRSHLQAALSTLTNNIQNESRRYQTISNALTTMHQVASNSIRNMK
jgi:outer membrane murein-binding lipoprotein Lpp